ncbi:serine protease 27-like [Carettochelys insculpta]|uniref:serine protease 27-like n=1 Tax=Carettochelys insculpta TaxID=44489 RepID=UPI003EBB7560
MAGTGQQQWAAQRSWAQSRRVLLALLALAGLQGEGPHTGSCLAQSVCGRKGASKRIVGGSDSRDGEWPWQVSLQLNGTHHCGGSLITAQWVLTAAHCIREHKTPGFFSVLLGTHQQRQPGPSAVLLPVKQLIPHPRYEGKISSGDIALVELAQAANLSERILPVCLPDAQTQFPPGTSCWVTGWGVVQEGAGASEAPEMLQKVEVPLVAQDKCNDLYKGGGQQDIQEDMLCAGYARGGHDACQGDSGGPLVCKMGEIWLQLGLVSWGEGCAGRDRPGVYIRVTSYLNWLHKHIPELTFVRGTAEGMDHDDHSNREQKGDVRGFSHAPAVLANTLLLVACVLHLL